MKGKPIRNSVGVLIAVILLITVCFNNTKWQIPLYLAAFGAWTGFLAVRWLWRKRPLRRKRLRRRRTKTDTQTTRLLLGHLNGRITEQLHVVFPEATWQWQTEDPARVAQGGMGRILLYGTGAYTHADVMVDGYYRISVEMLNVTPLRTLLGDPPPPFPVDPADWFDRVGREALTRIIIDLNSRGYTRVYLRETGEVYTIEGDTESIKETLQHMPGKAMWPTLCTVFTRFGLNTTMEPERIAITWT